MQMLLEIGQKQLLRPVCFLKINKTCLPMVNEILTKKNKKKLREWCKNTNFNTPKKPDDFNSIVDFILVNTIPRFRKPCERYYEGRGTDLKTYCLKNKNPYLLQQVDNCIYNAIYLILTHGDIKSFQKLRELIYSFYPTGRI